MKVTMPFRECPSFNRCSANVCPLDPLQHEKEVLQGEDRCKAEKPTRMRIGSKYPDLLRFVGLTKREFQARQAWNSLSPEQRGIRTQALANARKSIVARGKGAL